MKARLHLHLNGRPTPNLPLELRLEGEEVRGVFRQENPVLGEVALPFASRLEGEHLKALPLPPPSLRIEGRMRTQASGVELELELELVLPEGQSWGERAFARILELLFFKGLERSLPQATLPPV
ncbi:DUF3809 family protein [Thermus amyloliquefaciens]|uniref:DUF3809 family protein n=1 Tax=Thermus amyloliquefaciens TaxID=1449080 RepID=UPI0005712969|nr:DUF3809 family protein [Thermus amyloliquefaciens]